MSKLVRGLPQHQSRNSCKKQLLRQFRFGHCAIFSMISLSYTVDYLWEVGVVVCRSHPEQLQHLLLRILTQ